MGEKRKKKKKPKQKFPLGSLGKKKNVPFILALVVIQSIMLWFFIFFCLFTIFSDF